MSESWDYHYLKDRVLYLVTDDICTFKALFASRDEAEKAIANRANDDDSIFTSTDIIAEVKGTEFFAWNDCSEPELDVEPWIEKLE